MAKFSFSMEGIDGLIVKAKGVAENARKTINDEMKAFANMVVEDAIAKVPADEGLLRNSIAAVIKDLDVSVVVRAHYAAFLEFGTRKFAAAYVGSLPPDWRSYAATFKSKGGMGDMDQFLMQIMDWVKRKGLSGTYSVKTKKRTGAKGARNFEDAEVAYPIALAILRNGIKAQPYLFPAYMKNKAVLISNLKKQFK